MCDLHRHTQIEKPAENEKNSFHYLFRAGQLGFNNRQGKEEIPRKGLLSDTQIIFQDIDAKMKEENSSVVYLGRRETVQNILITSPHTHKKNLSLFFVMLHLIS